MKTYERLLLTELRQERMLKDLDRMSTEIDDVAGCLEARGQETERGDDESDLQSSAYWDVLDLIHEAIEGIESNIEIRPLH